jgi:RimJ/RimL family protein N-acetyltransferase
MNAITIRALSSEEWPSFQEFRLHALREARSVFGSSYEVEATRTPQEWQDLVSGPSQQTFGLFAEERLVGITAVLPWKNDPAGETAVMAMSYILPEYRGRGFSRLHYEARLDWIREHPRFKRVVVSHRKSNESSRRAIQRHGFRLTHRVPRLWHDGTTEDEIFYELLLSRQDDGSGS